MTARRVITALNQMTGPLSTVQVYDKGGAVYNALASGYGVVGDGVTDDTTALNNLIASVNAAGGGTVLLPPVTYLCLAVQLKSNVRLSGYGATLKKNSGGAATHVLEALGATTATTTTLSSNATAGATTLSVSSVTGFADGDYLLIRDNTYKYSNQGRNQEIVQVLGTPSAGTITLAAALYGSYTTASSAEVVKLSAVTNASVEGLTLDQPTLGTGNYGGNFYGYLCQGLRLRDVRCLQPSDDPGIMVEASQDVIVERCSVYDGQNRSTSGYGYGLIANESCIGVTFRDCYTEAVRENNASNNARVVAFLGCVANYPHDDGFNTHGSGCEHVTIAGCTVLFSSGHGITVGFSGDHAVDKDILITNNTIIKSGGHGISIRSDAFKHTNIKVIGNTIDTWQLNAGSSYYAITAYFCEHVEISNNTITGPTNSIGRALSIELAGPGVVSSNAVFNCPNATAIFYRQCAWLRIEGNVARAVASAALTGQTTNTDVVVRGNTLSRSGGCTISYAGDESEVSGNLIDGVFQGVTLRTKAGTLSDSDFKGPRDGYCGVDTANSQLMFRSGGAWYTLRADVYNVLAYGLVGNDSTNNSAALTTLLATVSAAGGGCVYFLPGTYLLSPSLSVPSNVTLCGVRGQSKLHFTATAAGQIGLYIDGRTTAKTGIVIQDLTIYSNAAAYSGNTVIAYGIYLDNSTTGATESSDILIDGCDISQFALAGFSGNSNTSVTRRVVIQNCYFHDIGTPTHAPAAVAVGISNPPFGECVVRGNEFNNIGTTSSDWAVYLSRTSTDCRIEGNIIKDCAGGIQLFSSVSQNAAIANNTIHNPTAAWAIAVGGVAHKNVSVHGNQIWLATNNGRGGITITSLAAGAAHSVRGNVIDCGSLTIGNGAVTITGACPDTLIAGNTLYNLGSNMYGVYVTSTSGALRRLRIRGNTMHGGTGARGVWLREAAGTDQIDDAEVVGNKIFGGTYGVVLTGTARCKVIENEVTLSTGSNTECIRLEDGAGVNTTPLQADVRLNRGQAQNASNYVSYCGNGCRVESNVGFAVRLTPTMTDTNCTVRHNFGLGVAPIVTLTSSATPSLAAETLGSEVVKLTYSGATTVTAFSGCFAGEIRRLFATNGNVTLQNNSTIILAGGADKTLAANGSITLLFDGTAYREVV